MPSSPAINRGGLDAIVGVGDIPVYDQRGNPFGRVVNARFDLGAFEFQEASDLNLIVDTLVDESDDSFVPGDLSLREAVELANTFPSTDTIRFDPALSTTGPAVLVLSMGELAITDDVLIEGFGMGLLIIDASGNDPTPDMNNADGSRVFRIDDGVSGSQISVTISGLTITGGDVADGGGGIRSVENLTVAATTVRNNATSSGQVDLDTPGGGGIFSGAGNLTVVGSNIAENMSIGGSSNLGGGIHSSRGNLSVTGSTISNNSSRIGGGISVFHLGEAGSAFLSTVTVESSTISGNSSLGGSGIFCINAQLAVANSTISGNMATGGTPFPGGSHASGGGIHTRGNGHTTVTDSTVRDNTSAFEGGGITSTNALTLIGSTISGNTAEMHGGGIYAFTNVTLRDSIVSDNVARLGGGLFKLSGYGQIAIEDSTITDNTANSRGGGIFNDRGPLTVTGSTISGNTAEAESGGGISQGSGASRLHKARFTTMRPAPTAAGLRFLVARAKSRTPKCTITWPAAMAAESGSATAQSLSAVQRSTTTRPSNTAAVYFSGTLQPPRSAIPP